MFWINITEWFNLSLYYNFLLVASSDLPTDISTQAPLEVQQTHQCAARDWKSNGIYAYEHISNTIVRASPPKLLPQNVS